MTDTANFAQPTHNTSIKWRDDKNDGDDDGNDDGDDDGNDNGDDNDADDDGDDGDDDGSGRIIMRVYDGNGR